MHLHIPYRGAAPAVTDAIGGQIDMIVAGQSSVALQIAAGKLRALPVTTAKRSAQLPDGKGASGSPTYIRGW